MAIKKVFGSSTIRKPGSYSTVKQDNSQGAPLSDNGTLFIVGEAEQGKPSTESGIVEYSATNLAQLISDYGSGPIVDVARAAIQAPGKGQGISQPDKVMVWKTNASTQAAKTFNSLITFKARSWGAAGNLISIAMANGDVSARQRIITITKGSDVQILDQNEALPQLVVTYTGAGSGATLSITGSLTNKVLSTTCTGASSDDISVNLNDFSSVKELYLHLSQIANYTVTLGTSSTAAITDPASLDRVTALDIKAGAKTLYRLQQEIVDLVNDNAELVEAEIASFATGIPSTTAATFLTGGAKGASATSDFSDGFAASFSKDWNVCIPAISRDATDDIADALTDSSSAYDIDSVAAALSTHLNLRSNVRNRKEAQGMVGYRADTKATVYAFCQTIGDALIQVMAQDVLVADLDATLVWKQPHVAAALAAGIRLGTDVGEPLTFKYANCNGIGHAVDVDTGISQGDFDPNVDYDDAIDAGLTFMEEAAGGRRWVVDNTTYGADASFVWNRGSVVEAVQYIAKTLRETAELSFVGKKTSNGGASSAKSILRDKLIELNKANITTASDNGAPQGFKESSFSVTQTGNTMTVAVEVIPCQSIDFVFINFTVGDILQQA